MELTNNIWAIDDSLILLKDGSVLAVFEVEPQVINTIEDGEKEDSKDLVFNNLSSIAEYNDLAIHTINFDLDLAKKIALLSQDIEQDVGTSPLGNYVISKLEERLEEEVTYLTESRDYLVVPFLNGQYYDKESEIVALENSIENVDETIIEVGAGNALKLINGEEESYVATIPVYAYPKNVSYLHITFV